MKIEVEEISYHVEVCGEGFPLLMLHGFTGRGSNWLPFCTSLGKNSKMIMPDIVGHGLTEVHNYEEANFSLPSVAKDLTILLDKLGFEKVDVLGYSMGGRLALGFALSYPNRVRKLVLESSSPGLKTEIEREERRKSDSNLAESIIKNGIEPFVSRWENIPLFDSQKSLPEEIRLSVRNQRLRNDSLGLAKSLLGMGTGAQPSFWNHLQNLTANTLMIVGEQDIKFCLIAEEMQKDIKNGQIYKVHGAGHTIHVEQPEKFGTIVRDFLSNT
ncbi:2-succinyl-6-hydroxy-2,4-cyclohexadiene-1-carboxylate synthase [Pseudoneobacillus sp. C159]